MDKVVVLGAGLGTRMRSGDVEGLSESQRRVADSGVKALVPIDRPFLDYVLSTVAEAGFRRACLVIGPDHDELRHYYGEVVDARRLHFEFVVQAEPLGTADAVAAAREFACGDPFLVINADNHYPLQALQALRGLSGPGLVGFERSALVAQSNIPAERIERFAVIEVAADRSLPRVGDKPSPEQLAPAGGRVGRRGVVGGAAALGGTRASSASTVRGAWPRLLRTIHCSSVFHSAYARNENKMCA